MTIAIATFRTELRKHLGVDVSDPDWQDSDCDLMLNRTYWEIQDKFKFKQKESRTTLTYTVGVYNQVLTPSTLEAISKVFLVDPVTSEHIELIRKDVNSFDSGGIFDVKQNSGPPEDYYRENGNLYVYPIPDQTYSVIVLYQGTLADLSNGNTQTPIPQSWHEIILYGGIWRGFAKLGDMVQMTNFRGIYNDLILTSIPTDAKEEKDTHYNGVYPFGYDDAEL